MTICHRDFIAGLGAAAWPPVCTALIEKPASMKELHA
jgi:hypothetical protein